MGRGNGAARAAIRMLAPVRVGSAELADCRECPMCDLCLAHDNCLTDLSHLVWSAPFAPPGAPACGREVPSVAGRVLSANCRGHGGDLHMNTIGKQVGYLPIVSAHLLAAPGATAPGVTSCTSHDDVDASSFRRPRWPPSGRESCPARGPGVAPVRRRRGTVADAGQPLPAQRAQGDPSQRPRLLER